MSNTSNELRALLFKVLSNNTRLILIESLSMGDQSVNELCEKTHLQQSRVSHELRCLTVCGLVSFRRVGKKVIYSLNKETVFPILEAADRHVAKFGHRMEKCELITDARKLVVSELNV